MLAFISLDWLQHASGIVMDFLPIVWLFLGWMCLRAFRRIVGGKSKSVSFSVHDGISKGEWDEFKLSVFAQLSSLRDGTANQLSNFQHRLITSERDVEKFFTRYKDDKKAFKKQQEQAITATQDRVDARFKASDKDFEDRVSDILVLVMAMAFKTGEFKIDLDSEARLLKNQLFGVESSSGSLIVAYDCVNRIKTFAHMLGYESNIQGIAADILGNRTHICEVDSFIVQMSQVLASQDRLLKQVCELPHVGPLLSHKLELEVLEVRMKPIREALAQHLKNNPHLEEKEPYDPKDHKDTCNCDECMAYRGKQLVQSQPELEDMSAPEGPDDHPIGELIPESEGGDPEWPEIPECEAGPGCTECYPPPCPHCGKDEEDCYCAPELVAKGCPRCGDQVCDCNELIEETKEKKPHKAKPPKKLKKKAPLEEDDDPAGVYTDPL